MARNSEKAASMLFRFREQQAAELGLIDVGRTARPRRINSVDSVVMCEKWRAQVIRSISRTMARLHDSSLPAAQIRDLNDNVNQLLREKYAWEMRIRQLGGPDYVRVSAITAAAAAREGHDIGANTCGTGAAYRYFGRARELPGVKELLECASADAPSDPHIGLTSETLTRHKLRNMVDAAYFGYDLTDKREQEILKFEASREAELRSQCAIDKIKTSSTMPATTQLTTNVTPGLMDNSGPIIFPDDDDFPGAWYIPTLAEVHETLSKRKQHVSPNRVP